MIADDIKHAREKGDVKRTSLLKAVLKHYIAEHHATI
jgi:hypothetical protein